MRLSGKILNEDGYISIGIHNQNNRLQGRGLFIDPGEEGDYFYIGHFDDGEYN